MNSGMSFLDRQWVETGGKQVNVISPEEEKYSLRYINEQNHSKYKNKDIKTKVNRTKIVDV